jgi:multiple sugar transport system permease protein
MKSNKRMLKIWDTTGVVLLNLIALAIVIIYLLPMSYMLVTALKPEEQFQDLKAPIWPARHVTASYNGEEYPLYIVPLEDGEHQLLLMEKGRKESKFALPGVPDAALIEWEGNWRQLEPVYESYITFEAFTRWFDRLDFSMLGRNTLVVVGLTEIGVLVSSILVAYGFARFPVPKGGVLFLLLIGTIILPEKATLVPTYFTFVNLFNWQGTWWPLITPYWFGSTVYIFLLRQNFRSIPKELEEAAMLDGAGTLRILVSVIIPMAWPTVLTVSLLHFFFIWNESRLATLYLLSAPDKHLLVSSMLVQGNLGISPNHLQARALIAMIVPAVVLFFSQRFFMRGVRVTGIEK